MYFFIILFFISLAGIGLMIGRKLFVLEHGQILNHEEFLFEVPYLKEAKHITIKNIKKHGYAGLVTTLRFYIQSSNFLKEKYRKIKFRVTNTGEKNPLNDKKGEISKFLKIMGDYKNKIKRIKHNIHKEENF